MKVGKLQLHQGMFPQAMKNLRLVSEQIAPLCLDALSWRGLGLGILATRHACVCVRTYTHEHAHTCAQSV